MHKIYNTDAFILNSIDFNEADSVIILFSKDFGLLKAKASGVRYLKSKLRFSLQPFFFSKVSLVKGKNQWRIVNASSDLNLRNGFSHKVFMIFARVSNLLERLLQGEEQNEKLFEALFGAKSFFIKDEIKDEYLKDIEYILALRVLDSLGYIGSRSEFKEILDDYSNWNDEVLNLMNQKSKMALSEINRAIKESQL